MPQGADRPKSSSCSSSCSIQSTHELEHPALHCIALFKITVATEANTVPIKPLEDENDDEYENDFWVPTPKASAKGTHQRPEIFREVPKSARAALRLMYE